jgi:hypothetical protein
MPLTLAHKLQLMMTSAPSQRALARYLGVSHQQLGRWIKGERINPSTGEITNVPTDRQTVANINAAFAQYRRAVREHNRRERTPYTPETPLPATRLIAQRDYSGVKAGQPGRRVVVEGTGALSPELRRDALVGLMDSGDFIAASVRSVVDLMAYFKRGEVMYRGKRSRRLQGEKNRGQYRTALLKKIEAGFTSTPIYTKTVDARDAYAAADDLMHQLREKHEPAALSPDSVVGDQFVFTTRSIPSHAKPKPTQKRPSQAARKGVRGRGPK